MTKIFPMIAIDAERSHAKQYGRNRFVVPPEFGFEALNYDVITGVHYKETQNMSE